MQKKKNWKELFYWTARIVKTMNPNVSKLLFTKMNYKTVQSLDKLILPTVVGFIHAIKVGFTQTFRCEMSQKETAVLFKIFSAVFNSGA